MQKINDSTSEESLLAKVAEAKTASLELASVPSDTKNRALMRAAESILSKREALIAANKKDLDAAKTLLEQGKLSKSLVARLKLDDSKIDEISRMVDSVAALEDPVGKIAYSIKMDENLDLFKLTVPFGVVATVFEARPDALPQIAALCIKSGNAVILKGGSEAKESNRAIHSIIAEALIREGLPKGCTQLVEDREAVRKLLKMDGLIDLVIPRGSNEFVKYIQDNTRIPVLGHSAGICHIFVDRKADPVKAIEICNDARVQYPAACNAMKVLLIDSNAAPQLLPRIAARLTKSGVRLKCCPRAKAILESNGIAAEGASERDWETEYLELILPVKVVDGLDEAIAHINRYGSRHTDSILTEDSASAKKFLRMVDSSTVIHNASTRFSDGYRYGLGAEVGISTNKVHSRGPVGLEGLVTTKFILLGAGQKVGDYVGDDAKPFLHRRSGLEINGRY